MLRGSLVRRLRSSGYHSTSTFHSFRLFSSTSWSSGSSPSFEGYGSSSTGTTGSRFGNLHDDDEDVKTEEEKRFEAAEAQREIFRNKKGRGWSDPWDIDEMIDAGTTYESLPDFSPIHVSRISQERVKLFTRSVDGDKKEVVAIPTLAELAQLEQLPPPPGPHPADNAPLYALQRKRRQYQYIAEKVQTMAAPKVKAIQRMQDWDQKQEAVDILFEELEFGLQQEETILGRHPLFGKWVERALEEYLRSVQKKPNEGDSAKSKSEANESADASSNGDVKEESSPAPQPTKSDLSPIFIDVFNSKTDDKDVVVPRILTPLRVNPKKPSIGRMVEEWELAALKTSRRILVRACTRAVAVAVAEKEKPSRVIVHGRNGVGKSAALAAIVAAARSSSNSIVLYLPEGDNWHRNFSYCEPNERRKGLFDLPELQKEVCSQLLEMHSKEMEGLQVSMDVMEQFLTESELKLFQTTHEGGGPFSLVDVLQYAVDNVTLAGPCYSAGINVLMTQKDKDFIVVLDEYNCYLQKSLFYHEAYDPEVRKAIPHSLTTLLQPFMDAMAVSSASEEELTYMTLAKPVLMQRGCLVVATTESHAVKAEVTQNFVRNAQQQQSANDGDDDAPLVVVEVPRLSQLEVEHMVANYEAIGVGKLRLDKGETVMNENEMQYLRMVSGGEALKLMNACMM